MIKYQTVEDNEEENRIEKNGSSFDMDSLYEVKEQGKKMTHTFAFSQKVSFEYMINF